MSVRMACLTRMSAHTSLRAGSRTVVLLVGMALGACLCALCVAIVLVVMLRTAKTRSLDCTDGAGSLRLAGTDWFIFHGPSQPKQPRQAVEPIGATRPLPWSTFPSPEPARLDEMDVGPST